MWCRKTDTYEKTAFGSATNQRVIGRWEEDVSETYLNGVSFKDVITNASRPAEMMYRRREESASSRSQALSSKDKEPDQGAKHPSSSRH